MKNEAKLNVTDQTQKKQAKSNVNENCGTHNTTEIPLQISMTSTNK